MSQEIRRAMHDAAVRSELRYRWVNPHAWLASKIVEAISLPMIRGYALSLLAALDSDQVQDIFQTEMSDDGYFAPEPEDLP